MLGLGPVTCPEVSEQVHRGYALHLSSALRTGTSGGLLLVLMDAHAMRQIT